MIILVNIPVTYLCLKGTSEQSGIVCNTFYKIIFTINTEEPRTMIFPWFLTATVLMCQVTKTHSTRRRRELHNISFIVECEYTVRAINGRKLKTVQRRRGGGVRRTRPEICRQNHLSRGWGSMIPHNIGKLAPNSTYSAGGFIISVPGRGFFRALPT